MNIKHGYEPGRGGICSPLLPLHLIHICKYVVVIVVYRL